MKKALYYSKFPEADPPHGIFEDISNMSTEDYYRSKMNVIQLVYRKAVSDTLRGSNSIWNKLGFHWFGRGRYENLESQAGSFDRLLEVVDSSDKYEILSVETMDHVKNEFLLKIRLRIWSDSKNAWNIDVLCGLCSDFADLCELDPKDIRTLSDTNVIKIFIDQLRGTEHKVSCIDKDGFYITPEGYRYQFLV